jgi:hypothetical protein
MASAMGKRQNPIVKKMILEGGSPVFPGLKPWAVMQHGVLGLVRRPSGETAFDELESTHVPLV